MKRRFVQFFCQKIGNFHHKIILKKFFQLFEILESIELIKEFTQTYDQSVKEEVIKKIFEKLAANPSKFIIILDGLDKVFT